MSINLLVYHSTNPADALIDPVFHLFIFAGLFDAWLLVTNRDMGPAHT